MDDGMRYGETPQTRGARFSNGKSGDGLDHGSFGSFGHSIEDAARRVAEQQKEAGAEALGRVGRAIRSAADSLGEQSTPAVGLMQDGAQRIEHAGESLRNASVDDLMRQAASFARSQPLAFFGAAAVAGFALSRFLKSSSASAGSDAGARAQQHPRQQQG